MFAQKGIDSKVDWLLDSGASEHFVGNNVPLINIKKLSNPVNIKIAKSGIFLQAKQAGDIEVVSTVKGKENTIIIKDVLIVPGLQNNLLSVPKLEINGFRVIFENRKGLIEKNNVLVAVALRQKSKIYLLSFKYKEANANACMLTETLDLWHKRMGHLNVDGVKHLQDQVDGMKGDFSKSTMDLCRTCIEGKQTQQPHNRTRNRAKRPLQLIHSDLFGPVSPTSHDDKRYVLTFVDDCTHFTAAYLLKYKSEVLRYFKVYEAMATAHFNSKISRFRFDNGREYLSNEIKRVFFEEKGIQLELTIRYTPQQNGVAECMNQTIIERARCMLLGSKLAKNFWSEAVLTVVYVINRSFTSALNGEIPASTWYKEKINIKKLRIFGCIAFLRIPKELSSGKFESKTKECYMIDYCPNGYRLWSPEDNKILFGKNITFDETKFDYNLADGSFYQSHEIPETTENEENSEDLSHSRIDKKIQDNQMLNNSSSDTEYFDLEESPQKVPLRRSERMKSRPKHLEDYAVLALNAEAYLDDVPETFEEIKSRSDKEQWNQAIQEEIAALEMNHTWDLVTLPTGKRTIDSKWIFKLKTASNGKRYKARLVIKGCSQRRGLDYEETYAPVARLTTVRTLLAIILEENLLVCQMDVKNAFLHGILKEEIYIYEDSGYNCQKDIVCKLRRTLYGLKQAPRTWNETFNQFVKSLGFENSGTDKCLYSYKNDSYKLYLLLYVDDIIIAGNDENEIQKIKSALNSRFHMKELGDLHTFLGINKRTSDKLFISQEMYAQKLLKLFGMEECKPAKISMETKRPKEEDSEPTEKSKPYRELIGCLMYLMLTTRPDLSTAVNHFSRFQSNATEAHWKGLKRILRYIPGTTELGLLYCKGGSDTLVAYSNADWGESADRKSMTSYLCKVYGNTVCWATKKQSTMALSTEAEYVALAMMATELLWLKNLLRDLGANCKESIKVFEDNQSTIHLLHRWEHKRLKHVDIKYNFIRDLQESNIINVVYVNTKNQIADILTKALPFEQFDKLRTS